MVHTTKKGKYKMSRKSVQDILLEEVQQTRKDVSSQSKILTEAVTLLSEVREQTIKTNGRVTNLEAWRNRIIGATGVISALLTYLFMK